ncbi:hypothetical protein EDB92DRAFT_1837568 [Lactarius akahatsu]|uniref:Nucleic acid-binding protein n=1 Tax=Lactarius akahatsu TaxID=416441 RepID=A0AAD4QBC8_9AGAM|nr:hypothetical protein EDB92DRAFT_1837568 [Lactarius akahatsu]
MPPMSFVGVVTKAGFMKKTATVTVSRWVIDKRTGKRISQDKKFLVHDERNQLRAEDSVLIRNCPPISARKRFTLEKIVRSPETERALAHATAPPAALPTPAP